MRQKGELTAAGRGLPFWHTRRGALGSNRLRHNPMSTAWAIEPFFQCRLQLLSRCPTLLKAGALNSHQLVTTDASIYYTELTQKDCLAARLPFDIGQCELGERP